MCLIVRELVERETDRLLVEETIDLGSAIR